MAFFPLLFALLPGFAWLFFYLQEDPRPEPKSLIAITFVNGAISAFVALIIQVWLKKAGWAVELPSVAGTTVSSSSLPQAVMFTIILFALVEETIKFYAAYFTVRNKPEFDEPVDAMIYTVVAALGFATMENIGAILPAETKNLDLPEIAQTLSLRFVGATLLHALAASFIGYYWALAIRNFGSNFYLVQGIAAATLLHAVFNYLIIAYGTFIYTLVLLITAGMFSLVDFEKLKQRRV